MAKITDFELDLIEFALSVYGETAAGGLDSLQLGDFLRACDLNPTLAELKRYGVAEKIGEKFYTSEECIKIYGESKGQKKDQGCYEDFVEFMRVYDTYSSGMVILDELTHSLLNLGEKLSEAQVSQIYSDCLPSQSEEGEIEYDIFLRKLTLKPLLKDKPVVASPVEP